MLNRIRKIVEPGMEVVAMGAASTRLPPIGWTVLSLVLAGLSGAVYAGAAGGMQGLAGLLLLASGFLDMVDGSVARLTGRVTLRGAFMDSTIDRMSEVSVYAGIILRNDTSPLAVLLALSFSMLVSYSRARGEALGVKMSGIGVGERAERILVLGVASLLNYVAIGVIIVALLAAVTFVHRMIHASRMIA